MNKPLRVFILSNQDLTSNILFANLLKEPYLQIVGAAFTSTLVKGKGGISGAFSVLKKTGWRYWLFLVFTNGFFALREKLDVILAKFLKHSPTWLPTIRASCIRKNIPLYYSGNFNDPKFVNEVRKTQPDLLLIRIDQILKEEILSVAPIGTWCIHSSLLPSYKGIAAEFQAILGKEDIYGTTIFKVVKQLDEGPSLYQIEISLDLKDSLFRSIYKNNIAGSELTKSVLLECATHGAAATRLVSRSLNTSYFSWPKPQAVEEFSKRGHKFIKMFEAISFAFQCLFRW